MSDFAIGLSLFGLMLVLMVVRVPIAITMFVAGAVGFIIFAGFDVFLNFLKNLTFARLSVYDLSVIPLFLLMGQFATHGGLSRALFGFTNALLGHLRGGMAMAAIFACAMFGAVSGSSVATAATIAHVALPEMRRLKYSGRLATATVAAGGTMGIMVPPSTILVIYAILTQQNIAKMFAAVIIPGTIAALGYILAIAIYVRLQPEHAPAAQPRKSGAEILKTFRQVWAVALIFIVVFGGIYGGFFVPTEAAAVGAAATFLLAVVNRELTLKGIAECFYGTAQTTAMIFLIFIGADMLNAALALSQMPVELARMISQSGFPPLLIILGILLLYIVLGAVMDELSMMMLTIPIFFPAVMALNMPELVGDQRAIWFGILVLMVVQIGLVAPPVGLNVYIINGLAKNVPMEESYRGIMPFLATDFIRLALLVSLPILSLYLVRLMG
jgi:C4-dicarboxylate transporter DctM subunit